MITIGCSESYCRGRGEAACFLPLGLKRRRRGKKGRSFLNRHLCAKVVPAERILGLFVAKYIVTMCTCVCVRACVRAYTTRAMIIFRMIGMLSLTAWLSHPALPPPPQTSTRGIPYGWGGVVVVGGGDGEREREKKKKTRQR